MCEWILTGAKICKILLIPPFPWNENFQSDFPRNPMNVMFIGAKCLYSYFLPKGS